MAGRPPPPKVPKRKKTKRKKRKKPKAFVLPPREPLLLPCGEELVRSTTSTVLGADLRLRSGMGEALRRSAREPPPRARSREPCASAAL